MKRAVDRADKYLEMASKLGDPTRLLDAALRRAQIDQQTNTIPALSQVTPVMNRLLAASAWDARLLFLLDLYDRRYTGSKDRATVEQWISAVTAAHPEALDSFPGLKRPIVAGPSAASNQELPASTITEGIKEGQRRSSSNMPNTVQPTLPSGLHTPVSNHKPEIDAGQIMPVSIPPNTGTESGVLTPSGEVETVQRPPKLESATLESAPETSGIADIGVASFGPITKVLETVHGPDNRVRITQTSSFPWRVHASLLITAQDGSAWIGTAWFIGPHTLATAGHCVHIKNSGVPGRDGWVKSIRVMPGRDGSTLPFGSVVADRFYSVIGWAESGDENYDYGAIIIPTELGNRTGWFGIGVIRR